MRCSKSGWLEAARRSAALAIFLWLGLWAGLVRASGVDELRVERRDGGLFLYAQLDFQLAPAVQDALLKGIAIHFVAEAKIVRERWYWFDQEVVSAERYTRLAYQPLTRRWRINVSSQPVASTDLGLGLIQQFDTLDEALGAMRRIAGWKIADAGELPSGAEEILQFRFRLDASQLPRTFQLGTLRQADWQLALQRRLPLRAELTR